MSTNIEKKFLVRYIISFQFDFNSIDIENSTSCLKDYVEFPTNRKYCGNRTGSVVIRNSKATIAFVTDDSNSGSGFNGTITALCKYKKTLYVNQMSRYDIEYIGDLRDTEICYIPESVRSDNAYYVNALYTW